MGLDSESVLDQKFIQMAKQMNLYLNHFPSHEKFAISQKIRNAAYEAYEFAVEAQTPWTYKKTSLSNLSKRHRQLRMLVRMAFEMEYFEFTNGRRQPGSTKAIARKRYDSLQGKIDEIGRMIGGWIKKEFPPNAQKERPVKREN